MKMKLNMLSAKIRSFRGILASTGLGLTSSLNVNTLYGTSSLNEMS